MIEKKEVENFELFIATKRGLSNLEEAHSMVNIIIFPVIFTDKQDIPSSKTI